MTETVRRALTILATAVLLSACGDNDPSTVGPSATTQSPTPSAPTTPPPTTPAPPASASPTFDGTVITVRVAGGKVSTASRRVSVKRGAKILLTVTSDKADEVHIHGHNIRRPIAAGATVQIVFLASIPGSIEIELEKSKIRLVELRVS